MARTSPATRQQGGGHPEAVVTTAAAAQRRGKVGRGPCPRGHCLAKMGIVVAHLDGGAAQVKPMSNRQKTTLSPHIDRMDGQNSACTEQEQIILHMYISPA